MQLAIVLFVAFIVYLIATAGAGNSAPKQTSEVSVDDAFQIYQNGALMLDARTQAEWDQYHAPNALLIPLDQLQTRINEVPNDRQILVVCNSSACSQQGRGLLIAAGYKAVSMAGSMQEWYSKGYAIDGAPQ